LDHPNRQT
jgi:hypothetical protein